MRRLLVLAAALLVLLLGWFVFFRDTRRVVDTDGGGPAASPGDESPDTTRGAQARRERRKTEEETAEPALTGFLAQWPQLGQERPQDPSLASVRGRLFSAPERPVGEGVVETSQRDELTARTRVRSDGSFLLKNVPPGKGIALTARAPGFASGGFDKLALGAGQVLDVGAVFLGGALDPDATNRLEVHVVRTAVSQTVVSQTGASQTGASQPGGSQTAGSQPVVGASVTATSAFYGSLVALGAWEKTPGGTIVHTTTDARGVAAFDKLPPAFYDVYAEAEGLTFAARARQLVQRDTQTQLTIELAPGLTIEGKVLDEEGKPIDGARIGAFRLQGFTMNPATSTAPDGTFAIGGLTRGPYWVWAAKQGRGQKDVQNVEAGTKDLTIVIAPGGELAIRVVDAASGAPVTAFGVRPFRNQPFAYQFSPRIDVKAEDGVWRQRLDKGSWGVEVTAPGYALRTMNAVSMEATEPVEVKLEPSGVVHGRVIAKSDGRPVRGARVFVKRGGLFATVVKDLQGATDGDGDFVLDGFPRAPVKITVQHVDYTEQSFDVEPAARGAGGALPPPVELALGEGGRVLGHAFGSGHAALAGRQITMMKGVDFTTQRTALVASDGSFEFRNVPPDRYSVSLGPGSEGDRGQQRSEVDVPDGGAVTVDFGMDSAGQRVTGRVVRGEEGVAGLGVVLDDGAGTNVRATSDASGHFVFDAVPPGRYAVRPSWGSALSSPLVVKAEEPPQEVVLEVPAAGSIEGRVVEDATGKPLSGAFVGCEQTANSAGSSLSGPRGSAARRPTAADGTFRVEDLEAGRYSVRAFRDPYGSEIVAEVALAAGEARTGVEIRMGTAGSVAGTAKSAAGRPVEGAAVQVRDAKGRRVFFVSFASTSADGSFAQGQLRPGEYDVTLEKEGWAPAAQHVVIETGKETRAEFTMLQGGRVELTALRSDRTPAAGATVTVLDAAGRTVEKGLTLQNVFSNVAPKTDSHGQLTIRGLAAGRYTLSCSGDTGAAATRAADVTEGASTAVEIVLEAR